MDNKTITVLKELILKQETDKMDNKTILMVQMVYPVEKELLHKSYRIKQENLEKLLLMQVFVMVISLVKKMLPMDSIIYQKTEEKLLGSKRELKTEMMTLDIQVKQRIHLQIQSQQVIKLQKLVSNLDKDEVQQHILLTKLTKYFLQRLIGKKK